VNPQPRTARELLSEYKKTLGSLYEPAEAESIAMLVAEKVLNASRVQLILQPDLLPSQAQQEEMQRILHQLETGKPVQYVLGETEFYGLPFRVDSRVLIPRPETEELVDWILKEHSRATEPLSILDICTGSGCIAIVLKKLLQGTVYALDVSEQALEAARTNAELNGSEVSFVQADILDPGFTLSRKFRIIVSNPPYVLLSQKNGMHRNVLNFEPHLALFVSDEDPLLFYRAIAEFALRHLEPEGKLYFEINEQYGAETARMMKQKGFREITIRKDLSGKDRMLTCSV
jgi:release factor glutamine methyltransferase